MNLLSVYALALAFTLPCVLGQGRIIRGQNAVPRQFPYQARIEVFFRTRDVRQCSASLIATEWLLTAAHCVYGGRYATVFLGMTGRGLGLTSQVLRSTNIFIHDYFNRTAVENDIALIKIPAVTLNTFIGIVQLPPMDGVNSDYAGQNVTASGWGRRGDTGPVSNNLQYTTLEVLSRCLENYTMHSGILCATGDNNSSTCRGDSGGPLVLTNDNTQVGIALGGFTLSCEGGAPAVFTRVTYYLQWIMDVSGVCYQ